MVLIARVSKFLTPSTSITACVDAQDNRFLELAVEAGARTIISGDDHLQTMHPYQGIAIMAPAEWLQQSGSSIHNNLMRQSDLPSRLFPRPAHIRHNPLPETPESA